MIVGQIIIDPYDALDILIPSDHIISKIYKGEFESTNYFLAGELKWYFFENIFYPINVLHYILNDKFFYFFNDIIIKVTAYFSFYILAKSFKISRVICGFGAVLYSSILFHLKPYCFALPLLP